MNTLPLLMRGTVLTLVFPSSSNLASRTGMSNVLFTPHSKNRHEIKALEPRSDRGETGLSEPRDMCVERFGYQAVFDRRAFLSDLKFTVTMGTFEIMMQIGH